MPTYEYLCTRCGASLEQFQQMSDEPLEICSACGGKLRRLIGTGAGVIIKGAARPPCHGGEGRLGGCCGQETGACGCNPERCHL